MSENNLPNIEGEENTAAENTAPAEETADDIAAVEDEIFVEADDAFAETDEMPEEAVSAEPVAEAFEAAPKKGGAGKVVAIIVIVVAILAAAGFGVYKYMTKNPYNELGYINVSGRTIAEVSASAGYESLDAFLADYGLPADMPEDTDESAAYYSIPVSKIAEMYGMQVADLKEVLGLGDDVDENTPWGEAEGKATLGKYIGEANLDAFKAEYGLGDEITADTLWSEVRNIVDQKTLEQQKEAQAQAQNMDANQPAVGDDDAELAPDEGAEGGAEAGTEAE